MEKIKKNAGVFIASAGLATGGGGVGYSKIQIDKMQDKIAILESAKLQAKQISNIDNIDLMQQQIENIKENINRNYREIQQEFQEYKVRNNIKHDVTSREIADINKELSTVIAMGKRNSAWIDNYNHTSQKLIIQKAIIKNNQNK